MTERRTTHVDISTRAWRFLKVFRWIYRHAWILLVILIVVAVAFIGTAEYVTSRPMFCASCHNMETYYESWQNDIHSAMGVICVDCHYAPGEQHTLKAKLRGLSQLASYSAGAFGGRLRGHVSSSSCGTTDCHPPGSFETKPLTFPKPKPGADKPVNHALKPFTHEKHLGPLAMGTELQCATCHERRAGEEHIATYTESCYLCHFNKKEFDSDRGRCLTCHEVPQEPIQTSGDNPITHQVLLDREVSCASCHGHDIQGGGPVYKERCLACHDRPGLLAEWELVKPHAHADKEETARCEACMKALESEHRLHKTHVETQHANCFDCHLLISHGKLAGNALSLSHQDCRSCHLEAHESTLALLAGRRPVQTDGTAADPFEMMSVHTICIGCHTEQTMTSRHRAVMRGGEKGCRQCHGEAYGVFQSWKDVLSTSDREVDDLQREAREALKAAHEHLPAETREHFQGDLDDANQILIFLRKAGAIHNKETSIELMDQAMDLLEDTIDEIEEVVKQENAPTEKQEESP